MNVLATNKGRATRRCGAIPVVAWLSVGAVGCGDDAGSAGETETSTSTGSDGTSRGETSTGGAQPTASTTDGGGSTESGEADSSGGSDTGTPTDDQPTVKAVIFDGTRFVAVGGVLPVDAPFGTLSETLVLTSDDGVQWTRRATSSSVALQSVAGGSSGYLAVGSEYGPDRVTYTLAMESADGATWSELPLPRGVTQLHSVAQQADRFVALAEANGENAALVRVNGREAWQVAQIGPLWWSPKVVAGNGLFVAHGEGPEIAWSEDGLQWQSDQPSATVTWVRWIEWRGDRFTGAAVFDCCFGEEPDGIEHLMLDSATGTTWQATGDANIEWVEDIASDGDRHVAVTLSGISIADGELETAQWTSVHEFGPDQGATSVAFGAGRFVVGGWGRPLLVSADGMTWEDGDAP